MRYLRGKLGSPEKMRFTLGLTGLWDCFEVASSAPARCRRGKRFPIFSSMPPSP